MANIPVILLALANDNEHKQRRLSNLQNEATAILQGLESAIEGQLCEVVILEKTTIDDILSAFREPKYKNRISIFHYAGHADGYKLLLETADNKNKVARGEGLVSYLSRQDSLQLIFLNGCSTEQQAEDLITAGTPAVIGTSTSIKDTVAMELASRFYKSIGSGATLETSWLDAIDEVKISNSENELRSFGDTEDEIKIINDRYPWDLKIRNGAEQVKQWNLPDASNNPLFKLPKIDEKYYQSLPYPPFRYLKYYTQDDAATFFGRGYEIRDLYEALQQRQNSITLLHGKSGVGKSSLLNAGLIPRIEKQFIVLYARRNDNLGLAKTLSNLLTGEDNGDLSAYWQQREKQAGKPLLVILDQVEEYETKAIGSIKDELGDLFNQIQSLFKQSSILKGQILLGYRKEFHVDVEKRLKERHLPYSSIYLEPLNRNGIMEAVQGLAKHEITKNYYNYSVEGLDDKSENDLASIVSDDLLEDKNSPVASLLQIHLSNLWKKINPKDKEPTHKQATKFKVDDYQQIAKTSLDDFFNDQINLIEKVNPQVVASGLVLEILQEHTTKFGTAKSCDSYIIEGNYQHCADIKLLQQQLVDNYLLSKESKNSTVLAHDTLGVIVSSHYANSNHSAQRTRRILSNKTTGRKTKEVIENVLDEHDFTEVEAGLNSIKKLSEKERKLLEKSWDAREQREKSRKRRKRLGISAVTTIAGVAVVATIFYFKAEAETRRANTSREQAEGLISKMIFDLQDKLLPIGRLDIMKDIQTWVDDYYQTLGNQQGVEEIKRRMATNILQTGETLKLQGELHKATQKYLQANTIFRQLMKDNSHDMDKKRDLSVSYEKLGDIYSAQGQLDKALNAFEATLSIRIELTKNDPNNIIWSQDIAVNYIKLGDIYTTQGKLDKALNTFIKSFVIREKLANNDMNNLTKQRDLSISYDRLGNTYLTQGKLDKALNNFLSANKIQKILVKNNSNNSQWQRNLAITYNKLADIYLAKNKQDETLNSLSSAHEIHLKLSKKDPSNTNWQHNLSISYGRLGSLYSIKNKLNKSFNAFYSAHKIHLKLIKKDPLNTDWKDGLSTSFAHLGESYRKQGKIYKAIEQYNQSLIISKELVKIDKNNSIWQRGVTIPLIQLMRLHSQNNQYTIAIKSGEEAVEILNNLQKEGKLHGKHKAWPKRVKKLLNEVKQEMLMKLLKNQDIS